MNSSRTPTIGAPPFAQKVAATAGDGFLAGMVSALMVSILLPTVIALAVEYSLLFLLLLIPFYFLGKYWYAFHNYTIDTDFSWQKHYVRAYECYQAVKDDPIVEPLARPLAEEIMNHVVSQDTSHMCHLAYKGDTYCVRRLELLEKMAPRHKRDTNSIAKAERFLADVESMMLE